MNPEQNFPQLQMILSSEKLNVRPSVNLPAGYAIRAYQPGDETRFYKLMELAGWPDWDQAKLKPWLYRILPEGWYMVTDPKDGEIVATAMATHDPTWVVPFCGEIGWVATHPAHTGQGIGTAVVAAVTTRFIEIGYRQIHLFTEHWRLPAIKIYLKLGYVPLVDADEVKSLWQHIFQKLTWPGKLESFVIHWS